MTQTLEFHPKFRVPSDEKFSRERTNALAGDLRQSINGEVRFDEGSRALYSTDGSNYRQVPIGVVIPRTIEDAIETVAVARKHGAPILARGGGTSLSGQSIGAGLVIDCSKYLNRILDIDPAGQTADDSNAGRGQFVRRSLHDGGTHGGECAGVGHSHL